MWGWEEQPLTHIPGSCTASGLGSWGKISTLIKTRWDLGSEALFAPCLFLTSMAHVCPYPRQMPAQISDPCPSPQAVPQLTFGNTCPTCDHSRREREGCRRGNQGQVSDPSSPLFPPAGTLSGQENGEKGKRKGLSHAKHLLCPRAQLMTPPLLVGVIPAEWVGPRRGGASEREAGPGPCWVGRDWLFGF